MTDAPGSFAEALRELRRRAGLTQQELAEGAGIRQWRAIMTGFAGS